MKQLVSFAALLVLMLVMPIVVVAAVHLNFVQAFIVLFVYLALYHPVFKGLGA